MRLSHFSTLLVGAALLLPAAAYADTMTTQPSDSQTPIVVIENAGDPYDVQPGETLTPVDAQPYDGDLDLSDGGQPSDVGDPGTGDLAATPEPSSMMLLGTAALGMGGILRRRQVAG